MGDDPAETFVTSRLAIRTETVINDRAFLNIGISFQSSLDMVMSIHTFLLNLSLRYLRRFRSSNGSTDGRVTGNDAQAVKMIPKKNLSVVKTRLREFIILSHEMEI